MSEVVLCDAVAEQIRSVVTQNRDARWIDVRPTGQPTSAITSDVFIAIHSEGWTFGGRAGVTGSGFGSSGGLDNGISEEYWVHVTVSVKLAANHKDFWGMSLSMDWDKSLSYAVRQVINAVHLQPDVIIMANQRLNTAISSPFVEMLRATGEVNGKEERGTDWWGATTIARSTRVNQVFGFSQTVKFFGGKRIQGIGSYT